MSQAVPKSSHDARPPAGTQHLLACKGKSSLETLFFLQTLASDDLRRTTEATELMESALSMKGFVPVVKVYKKRDNHSLS
jgi:hypothetical protein